MNSRDEYLRHLDGLRDQIVFCSWAGTNALSPQRAMALLSVTMRIGVPVVCVTPGNLMDWQHPDQPFHPAYEFLSATHRADYLRTYFMHHYGGGYTDIKQTLRPWRGFFERLQAHPGHDGLGYTEISPRGVAPVPPPLGDELRANYQKLIGLCAFIFRKQSPFTTAWLNATHALLDAKLDTLRQHPARHPQDQTGVMFEGGERSQYPIAWTEMLGNLFHPLVLQMHERILHDEIAPSFTQYR